MKDARISGYFDTKYMTLLRIKQILHSLEGQKFANSFNLEQVNFRVTLVKYRFILPGVIFHSLIEAEHIVLFLFLKCVYEW